MTQVCMGVSRRASGALEEATECLSEEDATLAGSERTLKTAKAKPFCFLKDGRKKRGRVCSNSQKT